MDKKQRPSAEMTRQKILVAARSVFLAVGFDGTKTRAIAQLAGVHTNLVFHHFKNKETLWAKVKENILGESALLPQYDMSSAAAYFSSVISFRFQLFQSNPDIVKLIQWQQLTESNKSLTSNDAISPIRWLDDLKAFQADGQIRADVDVALMVLFVTYVTHPPFMQDVLPLTQRQVDQYKLIAIQSCLDQFLVEEV